MNDPGLDDEIEDFSQEVNQTLAPERTPSSKRSQFSRGSNQPLTKHQEEEREKIPDADGYFQPRRWWFTSTAFPLIAGTFSPFANMLSISALAEHWRVSVSSGQSASNGDPISDPHWLVALNAVSLAAAVAANILLLLNFGHRVRYSWAHPVTIVLWYMATTFLLIPLCMSYKLIIYPRTGFAFSQAYYYAIIGVVLYFIIGTLLLANYLGAFIFKAYPASFNSLTVPQRTLMVQSLFYAFYLSIGAVVFAHIEGWGYNDALYWADYTLLTIGIGSDFPVTTTLGRALLIPYAVMGITFIALIVNSVRGLILERAATKVVHRSLEKQREKTLKRMDSVDETWKKSEFEMMRQVEDKAERDRKIWSSTVSILMFITLWLGGAVAFKFSEEPQGWTYFEALYFCYTTLLTIGYGDFYPQSNSGKPFFVVWTLLAIPTVTILLSNVGQMVISGIKKSTLWLGQKTILPANITSGDFHFISPNEAQRLADEEAKIEHKKEGIPEGQEEGEDEAALGENVEKLGKAVEEAEEEKGGQDSLPARLAREIRGLARDIGKKPPRKYEWDEWVRWLELLGEKHNKKGEGFGGDEEQRENGQSGGGSKEGESLELTWLGDDGPLFFTGSETQWVLGRLCERLEEVLREDIKGRDEKPKKSDEVAGPSDSGETGAETPGRVQRSPKSS